jgi:hypothetical protein
VIWGFLSQGTASSPAGSLSVQPVGDGVVATLAGRY